MSATNLLQSPGFSDIDRHFAGFIARFGGERRWMELAAAALSRNIREGHLCISGARIAGSFGDPPDAETPLPWPTPGEWNAELRKSSAVGPPEAGTPLVLDGTGRLYLRRYWNYQMRLGQALLEKCGRNPATTPLSAATQQDAVDAALRNELTIICGGPGTGKTSTVMQILKRLLAESGAQRPRIALAAPTGKAAARLAEAVRQVTDKFADDDRSSELMPRGVKTIHSLLGRKPRSTAFRHDAENPLPLDVLIVDEASMVALALLAKLFDALPKHCRVLLLGDPDQLASVEPGAVLADMIDAASSPGSPLGGSVVTLRKNYRFSDDSGIQLACSAVRRGEAGTVIDLLRDAHRADLISTEYATLAEINEKLAAAAVAGFAEVTAERDPATALAKLNHFRILTPLRAGPLGVQGLNRAIVRALFAAGLIPAHGGMAYAGRPILILQNDHDLKLYNGELGLLLPDPAAPAKPHQLYAWFLGPENQVRRLTPARLPEHETAYAMTVHKSQGSEFDRVLFVLPDADSPVLTRELVYTALTRARSTLQLCWQEPVLRAAVARRAQRESGLRELLAPPPAVRSADRGNPKSKASPETLFLPGFEE